MTTRARTIRASARKNRQRPVSPQLALFECPLPPAPPGTHPTTVDERAYVLAYGTLGRFMVVREKVDPTFGVSFAVRALVPSEIRQVRRRMVGASGRVDRSLVPGGQPIWRYGIDKWGEIVGSPRSRSTRR